MALRDSHKVPFIARQTPLLSCDLDRYQDIISKQKTDVFGYKSSIVWDKNHATPTETFNMFLNHKVQEEEDSAACPSPSRPQLPYNIVDSPIDDWSILPPEWASLCTDNMTVDAKVLFSLPGLPWPPHPPFACVGGYPLLRHDRGSLCELLAHGPCVQRPRQAQGTFFVLFFFALCPFCSPRSRTIPVDG